MGPLDPQPSTFQITPATYNLKKKPCKQVQATKINTTDYQY